MNINPCYTRKLSQGIKPPSHSLPRRLGMAEHEKSDDVNYSNTMRFGVTVLLFFDFAFAVWDFGVQGDYFGTKQKWGLDEDNSPQTDRSQ